MKKHVFSVIALSLLLCSCYPAQIVTVTPYNDYQKSYYTTVTNPYSNMVTTTTRVFPAMEDLSLYLDLQAVGAAFAQSSSIQEFESLLNNSSYIISDLDLNCDGYVDYLRVVETVENFTHVLVIQAVLAPDIYQDIATVIVEAPSSQSWYVQIVGAPFIYGPNYILRPLFAARPPIFNHFYKPMYKPWRSPWHWGYFPSYYRHPAPLQLGHYQAYVDTYVNNHRYCSRYEFAKEPHFKDYLRVCAPDQRNDYGKQHPERSFTVRTAEIPDNQQRNRNASNAREISERSRAGATTTTTRAAAPSTPAPSVSSQSRRNTAPSTTAGTSSRPASITVQSHVRSSGSTNTSIRTTSYSGTTTTVNRRSGTSSTSRTSRTSSDSSNSSNSGRR